MEMYTTDKPSLLKLVTELKKVTTGQTFYVYETIGGNWIITDRPSGELKPEVIVHALDNNFAEWELNK